MKKNEKKSHKSWFAYGVIAVLALFILCPYISDKINEAMFAKVDEKMRTVDLFTLDADAGNKYIVYQQDTTDYDDTYHDSYFHYEKADYVSSELQAKKPEEVGYIIVISYRHTLYGTYSTDKGPGPHINSRSAYVCDTYINIYDRHTGSFLRDDAIMIRGGFPPGTIKMGQEPIGTIATTAEITAAVNKILGRDDESTSESIETNDVGTKKESTESEELIDKELEERILGKWNQSVPLDATSSIELLDDHTATLNMLDNSYSLEWELESNINGFVTIIFKIDGKDAFTGNYIYAPSKDLAMLVLDINGNILQFAQE